jgi:selenoprotein W-related protein
LPRAASLAEKLLNQYANRIGEVALMPSSGGAFEVSLDGEKVYSKLETGTFPSERALLGQMGPKL